MSERVPGSFRDPAGFVFRRHGVLYRQVNEQKRANYDALMTSGLYDALVRQDLLVPHEEVAVPPVEPSLASLVIRPEPVPFVSYPYEWSPGQLQAAGEATLTIQELAMEHNMSLRDASAYNIQFRDGRPVLIDTLSFEPLEEHAPWVAYGQYCRHFVAPLALMKYVDVRLGSLLRTEIDGVPLDLAARLLPGRTRLRFGLGIHLHAHSSSQQRHAGDAPVDVTEAPSPRAMSRNALAGLVHSLLTLTRRLTWEPPASAWRDYYAQRESYTGDSSSHKRALVGEMLASVGADTVWDLGANTGQISQLAADVTGGHVVAVEMDPSAVELHWRACRTEPRRRVLPLLNDLSNPSPSQGWGHDERQSLEARGPADVVLALALVHHLAIGNNVPLRSVVAWFARLGRRVIVEWVPKDDPMVARLLARREDVFDAYTTEEFEAAVRAFFEVRSREAVRGSMRTIYLLERR